MIERFNLWIEKVGVDKLLHFLVAAWLTSAASVISMFAMFITILFVIVVSVVKEVIDDHFDCRDIGAALLGSGVSVIIYLILTSIFNTNAIVN